MLSSLKLTSTTPLGKEQDKKIKTIWKSLNENNDSPQFRVPVDWRGMGLMDYPKIVKYPMDLGTISQKMKEDRYNTVEEVLDDIQLIWDNCKLYNQQGCWIYDLADKLERSFKKMVKTYLPNIQLPAVPVPQQNAQKTSPQPVPPKQQQQITYQDKIKFTDRLKKLNPEELGQLVKAIMSVCPLAFREVDDQKAQILVDNMDIISFKEINDILANIEEEEDPMAKRIKM